MHITHLALSEQVAARRESVTRALAELEEKGHVRCHRGRIVLLDDKSAVALQVGLFGVPLLAAVIALGVSVLFALVAARAMHDTDIVPTKALASLAQLAFALIAPGHVPTATMVPNVTCGAAIHNADALSMMKTARRLDVPWRVPFLAQLAGCVVGAIVVVPAYFALVGDASRTLPSSMFPAPAVLVWRSVASTLAHGLSGLPSAVRLMMAVGAAAGIVLALMERFVPKSLAWLVPSPIGLGTGMILPASSSLSIVLGALAAETARRRLTLPVAGGDVPSIVAASVMAGESLAGIGWQVSHALLVR